MNHPKDIRLGGYTTSRREINDLFIAWLAISFAFANIISTGSGFVYTLLISGLTVGLGFILHELGHKVLAQRYGCFAEFRAWKSMLFFAVIMSFFGVIFAAPGAVMISGPVGKRRNGKISAAGPTINIALGAIFFVIMMFSGSKVLVDIGMIGATINLWLGLFNLLPIWNFDGKKIWEWSKAYYIILGVVGLGLLFASSL